MYPFKSDRVIGKKGRDGERRKNRREGQRRYVKKANKL
jgi:hypothetical protein